MQSKPFMQIQSHDINAKIVNVHSNKTNHLLCSATIDGSIFVYEYSAQNVASGATGGAQTKVEIEEIEFKNSL